MTRVNPRRKSGPPLIRPTRFNAYARAMINGLGVQSMGGGTTLLPKRVSNVSIRFVGETKMRVPPMPPKGNRSEAAMAFRKIQKTTKSKRIEQKAPKTPDSMSPSKTKKMRANVFRMMKSVIRRRANMESIKQLYRRRKYYLSMCSTDWMWGDSLVRYTQLIHILSVVMKRVMFLHKQKKAEVYYVHSRTIYADVMRLIDSSMRKNGSPGSTMHYTPTKFQKDCEVIFRMMNSRNPSMELDSVIHMRKSVIQVGSNVVGKATREKAKRIFDGVVIQMVMNEKTTTKTHSQYGFLDILCICGRQMVNGYARAIAFASSGVSFRTSIPGKYWYRGWSLYETPNMMKMWQLEQGKMLRSVGRVSFAFNVTNHANACELYEASKSVVNGKTKVVVGLVIFDPNGRKYMEKRLINERKAYMSFYNFCHEMARIAYPGATLYITSFTDIKLVQSKGLLRINNGGSMGLGHVQCMTQFRLNFTGFCQLISLFFVYRIKTESHKRSSVSAMEKIMREYRVGVMKDLWSPETPKSMVAHTRFFNHFSVFLGKIAEMAHMQGLIAHAQG